jgi:hypothetical protein
MSKKSILNVMSCDSALKYNYYKVKTVEHISDIK